MKNAEFESLPYATTTLTSSKYSYQVNRIINSMSTITSLDGIQTQQGLPVKKTNNTPEKKRETNKASLPSINELGWSTSGWLLHRSKANLFAFLVFILIGVIGVAFAKTYSSNTCRQRRHVIVAYGIIEILLGYGFYALIRPHLSSFGGRLDTFTGKQAISRRLHDLMLEDEEKLRALKSATQEQEKHSKPKSQFD